MTPCLSHIPPLMAVYFPTRYSSSLSTHTHIFITNSQGLQKTTARIREASSQEVDMERAAHGMADPEIQAILSDPIIRQVLTDINENPTAGRKALSDPGVAAKIEKLIAAGVLRTG